MSTDPALGEYVPLAPVNDEAKKHNQNLPGMGGLFNIVNLSLYHYAGNNPVRYIDPTGMMEEETEKIDNFISSTDDITTFTLSVYEAVCQNKTSVQSILSEKYNELGVTEGIVIGFKLGKGDPFNSKLVAEASGTISNVLLAATIVLDFIDVCLVYKNSGGDVAATTKRFIRNLVTTSLTLAAGKLGATLGGTIGSFISPGIGTIIGGALGGIGSGLFVNIKLNEFFDEYGW